MKKLRLAIQIISIICLASFAGGMVMLYTALVSFWKQIPPADFLDWFSNYSSGIEDATGPFVKLSMLLPLISIILVWKVPRSRLYWLLSYAFVIGIMVVTFAFFIEANSSFASKTIELSLVAEKVNTWGNLHLLRIGMGFISAILGGIGLVKYIGSMNSNQPDGK